MFFFVKLNICGFNVNESSHCYIVKMVYIRSIFRKYAVTESTFRYWIEYLYQRLKSEYNLRYRSTVASLKHHRKYMNCVDEEKDGKFVGFESEIDLVTALVDYVFWSEIQYKKTPYMKNEHADVRCHFGQSFAKHRFRVWMERYGYLSGNRATSFSMVLVG